MDRHEQKLHRKWIIKCTCLASRGRKDTPRAPSTTASKIRARARQGGPKNAATASHGHQLAHTYRRTVRAGQGPELLPDMQLSNRDEILIISNLFSGRLFFMENPFFFGCIGNKDVALRRTSKMPSSVLWRAWLMGRTSDRWYQPHWVRRWTTKATLIKSGRWRESANYELIMLMIGICKLVQLWKGWGW